MSLNLFLGKFTDFTEGFEKRGMGIDFIINSIFGFFFFDDIQIEQVFEFSLGGV